MPDIVVVTVVAASKKRGGCMSIWNEVSAIDVKVVTSTYLVYLMGVDQLQHEPQLASARHGLLARLDH